METYHKIPTTDGHLIYGTLNSTNSNQLIIFVHGFTGNQNEHHYFNAVPYFNSKNFDTFRFDFYPDEDQARTLDTISLTDHITDLNQIISHWQEQYSKIIVIGHSLAGLIVPQVNRSTIDQMILWDPTTNFTNVRKRAVTIKPT